MSQLISCYRCGQQNSPGQSHCWHCGAPIAYSCPNCRSVVYFGTQACTYCGMPLNWNQQQPPADNAFWCPNCRSVVYPGSEHCGNCGIQLDWGQQQKAANAAYCPKCGSVVYPEYDACKNCSLRLDWSWWKKAAEGAKTAETTEVMEAVKAEKAATAVEDKPAGKTAGNIVSWLITVPLIAAVLFLAFIYLSPDYDMRMVTSESMVPAINMGDLIITGPVSGKIRSGTVVTYERGEVMVTHRVISTKDNKLVTKGDAVEDSDPSPIAMSQVKGVYLFKIPSMGYLANFLRTKFGWFLIVILPAIFLLGLIFWEITREVMKKPQQRLYTESYTQRR